MVTDEGYKVLDALPGDCPECVSPFVIIYGAGADTGVYWAYCYFCTCCFCADSRSPNEVAERFAKKDFYGS